MQSNGWFLSCIFAIPLRSILWQKCNLKTTVYRNVSLKKNSVKISKIILATQSIFLVYLSLFGFLFAFGSAIPLFMEPIQKSSFVEVLYGAVLFIFLISGWRVYFWVLLSGPEKGKKISRNWLILSVIGIVCTILSSLYYAYAVGEGVDNVFLKHSTLFVFGLYFLPTAIHLGLEWYWQSKSTEKS
jgi:hypothetical protein